MGDDHERSAETSNEVVDSQGPGEVATNGLAKRITPQEAKGAPEPHEGNNRCIGSRVTVIDPEGGPANRGLHEFIIYDDALANLKL